MTLQNTKKFFLIDASELKSGSLLRDSPNTNSTNVNTVANQAYKERAKPLITKELHQVDLIMSTILNNDSLSEQQKVQEYNNALSKYQNLKSTTIQPTISEPVNLTSETSAYNPLTGIAVRYKNKANELLKLLQQNTDLKFMDNGEISINNERLAGTNISDLLNTSVNPIIKKDTIPGWNKFREVLIKGNIPRSLINQKVASQQYTPYTKIPTRSTNLDHWSNYDGKKDSPKTSKAGGKSKREKTSSGKTLKKVLF